MKAGWQIVPMEDLIEEISMGPFGSDVKVSNFVEEGIPVLNGSNLEGFRLKEESFRYFTVEKANSLGKANAFRGDVIVTHRGTIGQIVYIPEKSKFNRYVISQSQFRFRCGKRLLPEFIVYFFHSAFGRHLLLSNASQVGVPALARATSTFKQLKIPLPPLAEQKRIAAVLGALDDKIDLNRKMNANLEAQAQALFKSWFVDFEPFGGKMPKEWKKGRLGDIAEINPSRSLKKGEVTTCIEMADLSTSTAFPNDWGVKAFNGGMKFKNGDTIMARITPCLENGKAAFVNCLAEGEVAFGSTEYITICSKGLAPNEMFYSLVRDADFVSYATKHMNGSSGRQRVSGVDIAAYPFIIADDATYASITPILKSLFEKIRVNSLESRKLAETRDALLPKLMKGSVFAGEPLRRDKEVEV